MTAYQDDYHYLTSKTNVVELAAPGGARVLVAPAWQGRVMTSTMGKTGMSFGWVNRPLIDAGQDSPVFNNYGGEDRFWLGPEGGQFSLWFKKGDPFDMAHWFTPPGFNRGRFDITSQGKKSVAFATAFRVTNTSGTEFACAVKRVISVLESSRTADCLGVVKPESVQMVAFESHNTLCNAGESAWTADGGLLSIWILGQFKPLPNGRVVVPFLPGDDAKLGPRATTDYFGPLDADRCRLTDSHLFFRCDGVYRSKIGISAPRARRTLGSFDPDAGVLTVVQFNLPEGAARLPYVNSLWRIQDKPFAGDVVNSYNDGPEKPGAAALGGFYELESSSPAATLPAGGTATHIHRTFHFTGPSAELNEIAVRTLGVGLDEIQAT
ncbi:MAG: hypothetical protein FWE88_02820 [Phycisphaerae bacterium]|nr:hypothetical protein [Phycisphaerae bacterium]